MKPRPEPTFTCYFCGAVTKIVDAPCKCNPNELPRSRKP